MNASGTFDVQVIPQPQDENSPAQISRMLLDKKFHGDLQGTSKGRMLAGMTAVPGSAGGVAIEFVSGTLNGKKGSFLLQHNSWMQGGNYHLEINVVPDSGTDELAGISGKFQIIIEDKKHFYKFDYELK
jgi:hypothetical protein